MIQVLALTAFETVSIATMVGIMWKAQQNFVVAILCCAFYVCVRVPALHWALKSKAQRTKNTILTEVGIVIDRHDLSDPTVL